MRGIMKEKKGIIFMQNEIKKKQPLLNEFGHLSNPGYAKQLLFDYNRNQIKASKLRIKEWDYYLITNDKFGVAFTIADNAYIGFVSVTILDFVNKDYKFFSKIIPFTMGKLNMPPSSTTGDVIYKNKKIELSYITKENLKIIKVDIPKFNDLPLKGEIILSGIPKESMVIATPFEKKKKAFYYNQKINCMNAFGQLKHGNQIYKFDNADATLDWGRGVWTYDNTWFWGTCSSKINGVPFGFNIGYGFGDTSNASENMIFYDGKAHKLDQITFNIETINGKYQYLENWNFTSNDQRFELSFTPLLDRTDKISLLFLVSDQHQIFGRVNGFVILDDGTKLNVNNILASAEVVHNRW